MKTKFYLIIFLSILLASCSSLKSTVNDDLYYSPTDEQLASNDVYENPSYDKNESTIFAKKYDKQISDILEDTSKKDVDTTLYEYESPYDRLIVDSYSEAWDRRMDAMSSPYYGMNNYFVTFSDDYWYASMFFNDPYYNVVIMGDHIWVEPYWMSTWRPYHSWYSYGYGYYGYGYPFYRYGYYSSWYHRPYHYGYYNNWYYRPYYHHSHPYYHNGHVVSSSFHSYRQRSIAGISGTRSVARTPRELPETYMGRNVRSSSTVKSGIDRQSSRSVRSGEVSTVRTRANQSSETTRVRESSSSRTGSAVRTSSQGSSSGTRNYTRPKQTSRSTYSTPSRSTTRYNRPESSNVRSGQSSSGVSRSTYSPNSSGSSTRSRSTYTPSRSTRSSGSSVNRSGSSTRSSGSVRSSSGSSTRSSGSSVRSSGSSGRSSGSSGSSNSSRGRR